MNYSSIGANTATLTQNFSTESPTLSLEPKPLLIPPFLAAEIGLEPAIILQQLHYWLEKQCGKVFDGFRWIWNTYEQWTEQFPFFSAHVLRGAIAKLERLKLVISVKHDKSLWNHRKYYRIDYERLKALQLSICGISHHRSVENQQTDGAKIEHSYTETSAQNTQKLSISPLPPKEEPEKERVDILTSIESNSGNSPNSVETRVSATYPTEELEPDPWESGTIPWEAIATEMEAMETSLGLQEESDAPIEELELETRCVDEIEKEPATEMKASVEDKIPAAAGFDKKNEKPRKRDRPRRSISSNKHTTSQPRELYEWEIAQGRPYPVFLRWWADKKYVPQGGRWEADALGNAYSEFYNHPHKVTAVIFPQFMEYMQQVAENENQARFAGMKMVLPSCFKTLPVASKENVQQLMANVQDLIAGGASVALKQGIATPSCNQSMSYTEATEGAIAPLPQLEQPALPEVADKGLVAKSPLADIVARKQAAWRNLPHMRDSIRRWSEAIPGVVLGENGPELDSSECRRNKT